MERLTAATVQRGGALSIAWGCAAPVVVGWRLRSNGGWKMKFLAKLYHYIWVAFLFLGTVDIATLTGYIDWLPPKYAHAAIGALAVIQQLYLIYARWHNPDGTAATAAYVPPK
jgi:hypothetical protein